MKRCLMIPFLLISALVIAEQQTEDEWLAAFEGCEVSDRFMVGPRIPSGASVLRNADFLVGKWEGAADHITLTLDEYESPRPVDVRHWTEKITYHFSPDGRYAYEALNRYGYKGYKSGRRGTWRMEDETLVLSQTEKIDGYYQGGSPSWGAANCEKRLRVYFFNSDEIELQFASNQDLLNFTMADDTRYSQTHYSVGHDKYGFEVVRFFRPKYGSGWFSLTSPSRFKRVAAPYVPKSTPMPTNVSQAHPSQSPSPPPSVTPQRQYQEQSVQQPQVVQIVQQVVQQKPQQPKFTITSFVPVDTDNDFSYSFEVTLNDDASPSEFSSMYGSFINDMKKIYQSMNPSVDMKTLVVDAKPSLKNRKFVGVARMLTLCPEKLEYDAVTRRGKISLRFGTGQYEAARAWARKNIEALARDKNIALTTGVIPPAARFYLGREGLKDGNVLEIEFRTE